MYTVTLIYTHTHHWLENFPILMLQVIRNKEGIEIWTLLIYQTYVLNSIISSWQLRLVQVHFEDWLQKKIHRICQTRALVGTIGKNFKWILGRYYFHGFFRLPPLYNYPLFFNIKIIFTYSAKCNSIRMCYSEGINLSNLQPV